MSKKSPRVRPRRPADNRGATALDATLKTRTLTRLRRIEGQVRGLQRMVEADRDCADVLTQIASVHEALRAVGREVLRGRLRQCASATSGDRGRGSVAMYDDLVDLVYRHLR